MTLLAMAIAALCVAAGVTLFERTLIGGGQERRVRRSAVAGAFYPANPAELGKMIGDFLSGAAPPPLDDVVAITAPHAGYSFSGSVAAYSYALLQGRKFDRVVVIAPSHYEAFGFSSVYDGAAYSTPFGEVPVDQEFAAKLAKMSPAIKLSGIGHTPSPDHPEHALEVQLPFLQRVLGPFLLVPVVVGDQSYASCRALGLALAKLVAGTHTLIVASSDLSHYHTYAEAVALDRRTLRGIAEYDYFNLARNLELRVWEACGGGPIVAAMIAAERLGASEAKLLRYANSGDTGGGRSRVVGYSAVAFIRNVKPGNTAEEGFSLAQPEKDALLTIARRSVESAVREGNKYECSAGGLDALTHERGAFVTLTEHGQLRGCIGYVAPIKPLYLTVRDVAVMAALRDTRFRPVAASELEDLEYEISVLSPLRRVRDVREIQIGLHGLLIHQDGYEGLLLPQVASEAQWDRATFVEQTCSKAGLAANAWQDPAADLFRFTALVFGEVPRRSRRAAIAHPRLSPPPRGAPRYRRS